MGSDDALPIFPLPNVVLFPGIKTPLHIFEPRYRQMLEDVLADDRRIGMVVVRPEDAADMLGDPPVHPVGCAGSVGEHQKLPDGRYNLILHGTHRFRIRAEHPGAAGRLYRVAEVEALDDALAPEDVPRVAALRSRVSELVIELVPGSEPERAEAVSRNQLDRFDDVSFTNALCNALSASPHEKLGLLEADGIAQRLERLLALLQFQVSQRDASAPSSPSSGSIH